MEAEWIEVRYTPAMVNGAVSTFVLRRLRERRGIWLAAIGLLLLSTWLARAGFRPLALGYAGVALLPGVLAVVIWLAQSHRKKAALRRMGVPVAHVAVIDAGMAVRSGAGGATLPYAAGEAVWMRSDCWLLVTGSNRFTVLPIADLPEAWLADLVRRSPPCTR